jgi:hypothetical protein
MVTKNSVREIKRDRSRLRTCSAHTAQITTPCFREPITVSTVLWSTRRPSEARSKAESVHSRQLEAGSSALSSML